MTYKAHIKNGVAVLDDGAKLPEDTEVLIHTVNAPISLNDLFREVICKGKGLLADGSVQHDHYIYGTPKR